MESEIVRLNKTEIIDKSLQDNIMKEKDIGGKFYIEYFFVKCLAKHDLAFCSTQKLY